MNSGITIRMALLAFVLSFTLFAQNTPTGDLYAPPKIAMYGEQEHFKYLSVIETDCETMEQVIALTNQLRKAGALVSIITSPKRLLAWVPPMAQTSVMNARAAVPGGEVGVRFLGYTSQEVRSQSAMIRGGSPDYSEADETIVDYLDFVRRVKSPSELAEIEAMSQKLKEMGNDYPREEDNFTVYSDEPGPSGKNGIGLFGGPDPSLAVASEAEGLVIHTSFFVESKSGTGSYNWDDLVYTRYKNFYVAGINFWTAQASYYGKTLTAVWRLFGRTHSYSQVTGEPTSVGDGVYIPEVIKHITSATPGNSGWTNQACRYAYMYNQQIRASYSAPFAFCAFISYKPTLPKSIHPTAWSCTYNNGDREGIYFSSDTQYWQAGLNPFAASLRNCFAHEMGHLFGAPDEYLTSLADCNWTYRGMKNINCQRVQAAYLRPGWTMTGFDGIMDVNYLEGTSIATPVHTGLISAASASPVRCFKTSPAGIPYTLIMCDNAERDYTVSRCIPVSPDFCMRARVSPSRVISGTTYYFDYWEIERLSGAPTITNEDGPELSQWRLISTRANPITDVTAHFTSTPPAFNVANNTLSAWLSGFNHSTSPVQTIMLRWRVKYEMSEVETRIEYERTPGNWVELTSSNTSLGPLHQPINKWTGVQVYSVPTASGNENIQLNRTYKFRIVGYFNSNRGTPSNEASIKTRPTSPADSVFAYDANEPNSVASPKVLPSSGPGDTAITLRGATTIGGISGEFSWYIPKSDFYRITAIDLTSASYGENLTLTLRVRDGSNLSPLFRAKRAGSDTYINSTSGGEGVRKLKLTNDGEYVISIEPQIFSAWTMYDLVDHDGGQFAVGEYMMTVERGTNNPTFATFCKSCLRIVVQRPVEGWLLFDPFPPPELVLPGRMGFDRSKGANFSMLHIPPAGYENEGFDGDLFKGPSNPLGILIGLTTPTGNHTVEPLIRPIAANMAELLIFYPEGPGGPLTMRSLHPKGSEATATAVAPEGFVFVGWGYDTTATTNPLPVTMWRSKTLIAYYRPKPCTPAPMTRWTHSILVRNARQAETTMTYGMEAGAGDGLETGQTDLPPIPPVGTYDVRWSNIPGAQGSIIDLRAIKPDHTYLLRVQISSSTAPVRMTWAPPAASPAATYTMTIPGEPTPLDMRSTFEYTFTVEGTYSVRIEVKTPACPPPTGTQDVTVVPGRIDPGNFPCIDIELIVKNRQTGELLPFYNPFNLKIFEKNPNGEDTPARITKMYQMDSTIWIRLCSDEDDTRPNREIRVITDEDDPDKKKDTLDIDVQVPTPQGPGNLAKTTVRYGKEWDMVSLPLDVEEELAMSFFTTAPSTQVYWFDPAVGSYLNGNPMKFGKGYWVKSEGISVDMYGIERSTVEHTGLNGIGQPMGYGWNMVGAPSKSLAVAMINQTPAGGMKAIFGWDISSGYIVPTTIVPGKGYWVRVDPGTTLKMEGTSVQGGGDSRTLYARALQELDTRGWIEISNPVSDRRYLTISAAALSGMTKDALMLPPLPAPQVFDVRAENRTMVLQPGMNEISVQGEEELTFTLLHSAGGMTCRVLDAEGMPLSDLTEPGEHTVRLPDGNTGKLFIEIAYSGATAIGFALGTSYPNPATASIGVTIPYSVEEEGPVTIAIVDLLGREIRALLSNAVVKGAQIVRWDGKDNAGRAVPAGLYLCRMEGSGKSVSTKLSIVR